MALRPARAVDHLERYNVTRSNLNIYHNVVVGNKLHSRHPTEHIPPFTDASGDASASREWAQLLLHPVSWLIEQHPTLSVVVGDHLSAKPMFLHLPHIDLQPLIRVVPVKTAPDVGQVLEQEHNLPFDLSNHDLPLWRLVVVPIEDDPSSFYLLYTFHHVIGDGRSAMALTEQLIDQLNLQSRTRNRTTTRASSSQDWKIPIRSLKPIPASIESRTNCYPSLRTLLFEATRAVLLPAFVKKSLETRYWAGEVDSSLQVPNETELAYLQLCPDVTKRVLCATKARRTTVQSILATAAIFATKSVFMTGDGDVEEGITAVTKREKEKEKEKGSDEAIVFATPVSLRTLLQDPIAPEEQGNYTSEIIHNNIRVSEESSFWDMARVYREQVVVATTTPAGLRDLLEHFGMLSLLSTQDGGWEKFMASKVTKDQHGRKASVKLSNLGAGWAAAVVKDQTVESEFWVQDAVFSQSSGVTASALTMSVATANGVLTVVTTWQKAAFRGRARGELFVSEFKRILMEAIEEGRDEYFFRDV